jgi:uncharacterized protein
MKTVLLLICSNIFMTIAWYGRLKYRKAPLITVILVSWLIASAEYCFQVPANRLTLTVFSVFAWVYLCEAFKWNQFVSF